MHAMTELWSSVVTASWELAFVSVGFFLLGALAKRDSVLATIRLVWGEAKLNLVYHYLDAFLIVPLAALTVVGVDSLMKWTGIAILAPSLYQDWPFAATFLLAVAASDFVGYWRHRLMHTSVLWPVHAVHHSDTAVTWTTLARFHPINRLITVALNAAVLTLLGMPPAITGLSAIVRHFHGYYVHADLGWRHGCLRHVLVSPVMHRWHHVREVEGYGSNFATIFSLFDLIFGTFHVPAGKVPDLGVSEPAFPRSWFGQTIYPFRIWARRPGAHETRPRSDYV